MWKDISVNYGNCIIVCYVYDFGLTNCLDNSKLVYLKKKKTFLKLKKKKFTNFCVVQNYKCR